MEVDEECSWTRLEIFSRTFSSLSFLDSYFFFKKSEHMKRSQRKMNTYKILVSSTTLHLEHKRRINHARKNFPFFSSPSRVLEDKQQKRNEWRKEEEICVSTFSIITSLQRRLYTSDEKYSFLWKVENIFCTSILFLCVVSKLFDDGIFSLISSQKLSTSTWRSCFQFSSNLCRMPNAT